jgi:predicted DNA-binding protein (MmcQ/YjbR family)
MVGLDNPRLCFKCTPESFAELIEREDIRPAPYVGRYKWVMLDRLDAVGWSELRELIGQSYEMVAAKVPKKKRKAQKKKSQKRRRDR